MTKLKNFFKTKSAKIFAVLFMAIILVFSFAPSINADGPIFNGLPGDQKLIRGANSTQNPGATEWADPVEGNPQDVVSVLIYYHNIVEGTTAKNTTISVVLPSGEKTTQILKAKLSADNADAAKDTLTINSSEMVKVEYIPGTTKWFPNRQGNPTGEGQILPDGIVTPAGVNIGGIKGCWQFAGYVLFQVRLTHTPVPPATNPRIAIEKFVSHSNLDHINYDWQKSINAENGETLAFRLAFNNDGDAQAKNVVVKDILPAGLEFIPGSGTLFRSSGNSPIGAELFNDGAQIGTLGVGESAYILFEAKTTICGTLVNQTTITASGGLFGQDQVIIVVNCPVIKNPGLTIDKSVRNISRDETIFVKENNASPNDTIEYQIIVGNNGSSEAEDVTLRDVLPIPVSYLAGSLNITLPNGQVLTSTQIFNQDMVILSDLVPGQNITVHFKARVNFEIACGSRIENKALTTAQSGLKAQSFAYTNVVCQVTPTPTPQVKGLTILTPTGTPLGALAGIGLIIMVIGSAIVIYKFK